MPFCTHINSLPSVFILLLSAFRSSFPWSCHTWCVPRSIGILVGDFFIEGQAAVYMIWFDEFCEVPLIPNLSLPASPRACRYLPMPVGETIVPSENKCVTWEGQSFHTDCLTEIKLWKHGQKTRTLTEERGQQALNCRSLLGEGIAMEDSEPPGYTVRTLKEGTKKAKVKLRGCSVR